MVRPRNSNLSAYREPVNGVFQPADMAAGEYLRQFECDTFCGARHYYGRLGAQRASGVSHALRMIAAGIGDHAAAALFLGERGDLVVSAAQLERADRLKVLQLQVKAGATVSRSAE